MSLDDAGTSDYKVRDFVTVTLAIYAAYHILY